MSSMWCRMVFCTNKDSEKLSEEPYEEREALIMDAILFMHTYKKVQFSEDGTVVEWKNLRKYVRDYLARRDATITKCSMCGTEFFDTILLLCLGCGKELCEDHAYVIDDVNHYCVVCLRKGEHLG